MKERRSFVRFTDRKTGEDVIINLNQVSMIDVEQNRLYLHDNKWYVYFKSEHILKDIMEALNNNV